MSIKGVFKKIFRVTGKTISVARVLTLNLFFVLSIAVFYVAFTQFQPPGVPENAVLWLEPHGDIVEQYSFNDPLIKLLNPDQVALETSLNDIVTGLEFAAQDDRIHAVVISPDYISSVGISQINSIHRAIGKVKAAGKPVLARSRGITQHQYLLSSAADDIVLHPMGYVALTGYGIYRDYVKTALDKLKVDMHVFRVGDYKSAMEPFVRNDMSETAKKANGILLDDLWQQYVTVVAANRQLAPSDIQYYADNYVSLLAETGGDTAQAAVTAGLVDQLATNEQFWSTLEEMIPSIQDVDQAAVGLNEYLASHLIFNPVVEPVDSVAVVTIEGAIVDGEAPPGAAAGDSVAALLIAAKERDDIKSVVLRVNTGGGSAFASEIIRERVLALQAAGKPVVVSMGNVAASGGYWVSANADEIWASPTTITGSIGIFAAIPSANRAFNYLGIQNDGVGTTNVADGFSLTRPLNDQLAGAIQASIEHGYEQFINIVSDGRQLERADTLAVAGGRVWTGRAAHESGLVDYLGEIEDAIGAAAKLGGLNENANVIYLQDQRWAQLSLLQRFTAVLTQRVASSPLEKQFTALGEALMPVWLRHPDPANVYLRCVECVIGR